MGSGRRPKGGGPDPVTVMIYMGGTGLESRNGMATSDLQEMMAARLSGRSLESIIGDYDGTFVNNYYLGEPMTVGETKEISNADIGRERCRQPIVSRISTASITGHLSCRKNRPENFYII